jgi:YVTN family beta-propeller protein
MRNSTILLTDPIAIVGAVLLWCQTILASTNAAYLSPTALAAAKDGKTIYVACATANQVLCFDTSKREVSGSIPMPYSPSGLALSPDDTRLYVTCAAPESQVRVVELPMLRSSRGDEAPLSSPQPSTNNQQRLHQSLVTSAATVLNFSLPAGHTAMGPVLSPDGKTLYVCNRFNNDVSVIDLVSGRELRRIGVQREPVNGSVLDIDILEGGGQSPAHGAQSQS